MNELIQPSKYIGNLPIYTINTESEVYIKQVKPTSFYIVRRQAFEDRIGSPEGKLGQRWNEWKILTKARCVKSILKWIEENKIHVDRLVNMRMKKIIGENKEA